MVSLAVLSELAMVAAAVAVATAGTALPVAGTLLLTGDDMTVGVGELAVAVVAVAVLLDCVSGAAGLSSVQTRADANEHINVSIPMRTCVQLQRIRTVHGRMLLCTRLDFGGAGGFAPHGNDTRSEQNANRCNQ